MFPNLGLTGLYGALGAAPAVVLVVAPVLDAVLVEPLALDVVLVLEVPVVPPVPDVVLFGAPWPAPDRVLCWAAGSCSPCSLAGRESPDEADSLSSDILLLGSFATLW